ncbi:hypothetical protein EMPG_11406, partial [Blastomyces silverae]
KNIYILNNENVNIVLFYTQSDETTILYLNYHYKNKFFIYCVFLSSTISLQTIFQSEKVC